MTRRSEDAARVGVTYTEVPEKLELARLQKEEKETVATTIRTWEEMVNDVR